MILDVYLRGTHHSSMAIRFPYIFFISLTVLYVLPWINVIVVVESVCLYVFVCLVVSQTVLRFVPTRTGRLIDLSVRGILARWWVAIVQWKSTPMTEMSGSSSSSGRRLPVLPSIRPYKEVPPMLSSLPWSSYINTRDWGRSNGNSSYRFLYYRIMEFVFRYLHFDSQNSFIPAIVNSSGVGWFSIKFDECSWDADHIALFRGSLQILEWIAYVSHDDGVRRCTMRWCSKVLPNTLKRLSRSWTLAWRDPLKILWKSPFLQMEALHRRGTMQSKLIM